MIFALQGFLIPNQFIDGGVTGMSLLVTKKIGIHISIPLIIFNLPFIFIGYHKIGKSFAVQTSMAIILLTVGMLTIPTLDIGVREPILIALFGGFFIGLGIGLAIKGGCVLDGLEVIADYTHKKSGFSTSEIVMLFNTTLFIFAALSWSLNKPCTLSSPTSRP